MWRGRIAGPREPARTRCRATRTHTDAWVTPTWQEQWQAGMWWAHVYSLPRSEYWGGNAFGLFRPTFYTCQFPSFPLCGTMFPVNLFFAGHVAEQGASDEIEWIKARRSHGPESTRSPSEARAQKRTVDRVSGHRTLKILSRFRRSWATRGCIRSFQSRWNMKLMWDHAIVAHDHHMITTIDRSSQNRTAHDFRATFPYKMVFFPLSILTLD